MGSSNDRSGGPPRIAVFLVTYNRATHNGEQIDATLADLGPHDAVVVLDEASEDETVSRLDPADPRVRVARSGRNQACVKTWEHAIGEASGEIIMLSDQDDVRPPGRTETLTTALATADLAVGNYAVLRDEATGPVPPLPPSMDGHGPRNVAGRTAHLVGQVTLRRVHGRKPSPVRRRLVGKVARTRVRLVAFTEIAEARALRVHLGNNA